MQIGGVFKQHAHFWVHGCIALGLCDLGTYMCFLGDLLPHASQYYVGVSGGSALCVCMCERELSVWVILSYTYEFWESLQAAELGGSILRGVGGGTGLCLVLALGIHNGQKAWS